MFAVRVRLTPNQQKVARAQVANTIGARVTLDTLGAPPGKHLDVDDSLPATLEFHGRYLNSVRQDRDKGFTMLGSLDATVLRASFTSTLLQVPPGTEIAHVEATPSPDLPLRELSLVFDSDASDPNVKTTTCVLRLPSTDDGGLVEDPVPPFFELTTLLKLSGAEEAPLGTSDVLDVRVLALPPGPVLAARNPSVFRIASSFPRPDALPMLRELLARLQSDPTLVAVVVGHTDEFGTEGENLDLSLSRANATVALLTGDAGTLAAQFSTGSPTSWGMLEALDVIDAVSRQGDFPPPLAPGEEELLRYQNARGLAASGDLDAATIQTLTQEYTALMGTVFPAVTRFTALGGGASHAPRQLGFADVITSDNPDSRFFVNGRRVEIFLFADRATPPAETFAPNNPADPSYAAWCTRCLDVLTMPTGPLTIRVVGRDGVAIAGAKLAVFRLDGSERPEEGSSIASSASDGSGVVKFDVGPAFYCVSLDTEQGSRRLFCRVRGHVENLERFEFEPALSVVAQS